MARTWTRFVTFVSLFKVMKIDHHRGPVTSVKVTSAGDVMVSGSQDASVCLWSLESFSLLNTINLQLPVVMIDVSWDSVFLLACCSDNNLYLRTLATGTELHSLTDHKAKVRIKPTAHITRIPTHTLPWFAGSHRVFNSRQL